VSGAARTWTFDVTDMPPDAWVDQFSDAGQKERWSRLATPALRRLASASTAAQVLAVRAASGLHELAVHRTCASCGAHDHGRPRTDDPGVWLSASRSGDLVEVATSSAAVGVDIEVLGGPGDPIPYIALTEGEASWVSGHPQENRTNAFLRLWTRKEAVLKMLGVGLERDPSEVDVRYAVPTIRDTPVLWRGMHVRLVSYVPRDGYIAAVAGPALLRRDAAGPTRSLYESHQVAPVSRCPT
jgi:phosphopantetheinyl transferase